MCDDANRGPKATQHTRHGRRLARARAVRESLDWSGSTLERRLRDPELNFPRPVVIGRLRYFDEDEVDAWLAEQAEQRRWDRVRKRRVESTDEHGRADDAVRRDAGRSRGG
jgi:predicted DNA-binding transcriptional regulator AlpA